jgi:dTDP-L-rhamnose 4-epimerase
MGSRRVLITGGAGFIGTWLARKLLEQGHSVTVMDNFSAQIHGPNSDLSGDLKENVRLIRADVRDESACEDAVRDQDVVVHLAAETGTGQSMYQLRHYSDVNILGTATLLEKILCAKKPIQTLVVASSRAVYGEGAGQCATHGLVFPFGRSSEDMRLGHFEAKCPFCGAYLTSVPTPEEAPLRPISFYGLTKQAQEQMTLMYAGKIGINGFALRYQNVYGPGQSLRNPYTGILAIFSGQARKSEPIYMFEDGQESRDFVYVDDVIEATTLCVNAPFQPPVALNVGSGRPITVNEVVAIICRFFASSSPVFRTGAFREGDIRHNRADLTLLNRILEFRPSWEFEDGLERFLRWAQDQPLEGSSYERSLTEMREKGLLYG